MEERQRNVVRLLVARDAATRDPKSQSQIEAADRPDVRSPDFVRAKPFTTRLAGIIAVKRYSRSSLGGNSVICVTGVSDHG
jgi:hypothetical protein